MFSGNRKLRMKLKLNSHREHCAQPYCQCWGKRGPLAWKQLDCCSCGEDNDLKEWSWELPKEDAPSWAVVSEDQKLVTFHPIYSSGTGAVKGDTPLKHDHHYYWEIKMLTETYGTNIMIGLGTNKVNLADAHFKFTSLLGQDGESYGLSYTGVVRHNATGSRDTAGFCRGTIIGVRVDMWKGTLEFYLNRKPQGISFNNLRRHDALFPMICSTAAQSSMRLIYAASWKASLMVDAAKILAASEHSHRMPVPPGLRHMFRSQFWLTLPTAGYLEDDTDEEDTESEDSMETTESVHFHTNVLTEVLPSPYMNGFYIDSVEPNYRLVLWE